MAEEKKGQKVLAEYVLVKQVMRAKQTKIIMDAANDDRAKFDYYFVVLQKGADVKRDIQVGESPIFANHVSFTGLKLLRKTNEGMESIVIVHEGDIVGVDYDAVPIELASEEEESKLKLN